MADDDTKGDQKAITKPEPVVPVDKPASTSPIGPIEKSGPQPLPTL
jgi:hypothetical protein